MRTTALLVTSILTASAAIASAEVAQPTAIIDRSRTLPAGELEASLDLGFGRAGTVSATGTSYSNRTGLGLGVGYGFSSKLEGRLGYGFGVSPSSGKGPLGVAVAYDLLHLGGLTAALDAGVGYDIAAEDALPLTLGLEAQVKIGQQLAVFTPGQQFSIGLAGNNPVGLHLPIGIGYQANEHVFVDLQTEVAYLGFHGGGTAIFGADFVPVRLEGVYSLSNAFDLGVSFKDDLKAAGDSYGLGVFARLFL